MAEAFVTAAVGVVPGTALAEEVRSAFVKVNERDLATVYVIGSLFDHRVSKDDAISYMESLPGRKVLVTEGDYASLAERTCGTWHGVKDEVQYAAWGRKFRLAVDPSDHDPADGLLVHAGRRVDSGDSIRVLWVDWHDRFGPGGLNSLYALSVLADQMQVGMAIVDPDEKR